MMTILINVKYRETSAGSKKIYSYFLGFVFGRVGWWTGIGTVFM